MEKLYIITGAAGHLGSTIIRLLKRTTVAVRGLVLPSEPVAVSSRLTYIAGDIRDIESLRPLFEGCEHRETYVIHTAGIVDISEEVTPFMYDVNVNGTKNILELCGEYHVKRLVYVSSVHAIPEKDNLSVLHEVSEFSPDWVVGGYAKTKAEATQAVLHKAREGLNAVIVHPSGILGPFDNAGNHLVQLIADYARGRLPACVKGGYDFVDVRDVAYGCLMASFRGGSGECYILSNRHYEVKDVLTITRNISGGKKLLTLPIWMAKAALPFLALDAKRKKERPLYTKYSLYTLSSNDRFSHDKATSVLNYTPRDLRYTVRDTVAWIGRRKRLSSPLKL